MTINAKHENSEFSRWHHISNVRVLIADDHPVVRVGVRNLLSSESIIDVIGEAGDGDEALDLTRRLSPDILLLDVSMPRLSGFEVLQKIVTDQPSVKVVLLTANISARQVIEVLHAGARGVILKNTLTEGMSEAVMSVASGDYWIGGKRVVNLVTALQDLERKAARPKRKTYGLTPREMEVIGCIVQGYSNRDIAKQFNLSEETVKRHLSNIFDKTGVSTRLELAMFSIAHGLVDPNS